MPAARSKTASPTRKRQPAGAPASQASTAQPVAKEKPLPAVKAAPGAKASKAPKAAPATGTTATEKADKAKKPKLVRDSFTIPKDEYTVLEELKARAAKLGRPTKKSEVLRAGVMALAGMGDAAFLATVSVVPAMKTGRPAKA